jgi:hypothetical protein
MQSAEMQFASDFMALTIYIIIFWLTKALQKIK